MSVSVVSFPESNVVVEDSLVLVVVVVELLVEVEEVVETEEEVVVEEVVDDELEEELVVVVLVDVLSFGSKMKSSVQASIPVSAKSEPTAHRDRRSFEYL